MRYLITFLGLILFLTSCTDRDMHLRERSITVSDMQDIISHLSSDEFAGRKPFTPGEKITIDYLASQLMKIGFEPAFNGSYFQQVPMMEISSEIKGNVTVYTEKKILTLKAPDDIAITSPVPANDIEITGS